MSLIVMFQMNFNSILFDGIIEKINSVIFNSKYKRQSVYVDGYITKNIFVDIS